MNNGIVWGGFTTTAEETPKVTCENIENVPGIYERSRETREVLNEVLEMLCRFRREIGDYDVDTKESRPVESMSFKDEVMMINTLAFAIKGDLHRIMKEFG